MEFLLEHTWSGAAMLFVGAMIFVRTVANEKYRRDRYLEERLADKLRQMEKENQGNDTGSHDSHVTILKPVG